MPSLRLEQLFASYPSHLSVHQLALVLGVTAKTAYDYLQSGTIPAYRVQARWIILRDDICDYLEASSVHAKGHALS